MRGYRWTQRDGLEGYCPSCREWYPAPDGIEFLDYWPPAVDGGGSCRACYRELTRARQRKWEKKPGVWSQKLENQRAYRNANRDHVREQDRLRRQRDKVKRAAQGRAYRLLHREQHAAYQRAYYRRNRERILAADAALRRRKKAA